MLLSDDFMVRALIFGRLLVVAGGDFCFLGSKEIAKVSALRATQDCGDQDDSHDLKQLRHLSPY